MHCGIVHCALCIVHYALEKCFALFSQPIHLFLVEVRSESLKHHCVVVVDLLHFLGGEHGGVDEAGVVGEQRQRLKLQEVAEVLGLGTFYHKHHILGADAILAFLVNSWLVAGYHAWFQSDESHSSIEANTVRPLMNS